MQTSEREERELFVTKCGELLAMAKPHLVRCQYVLGKDMAPQGDYFDEDEYVIITCKNGHNYMRLVTGNSLNAIAQEIFTSMAHK